MLKSYLQIRRKFKTHFKRSPRKVSCIRSFKSLVNRLIIEKPITILAAGKGSRSGAKQRVVTPDLAKRVEMVVDEAVKVVELFLLQNLQESLIYPDHQLGDFLKINSHIKHTNRKRLYH